MDFERVDKASNFGEWYVWLIVVGAPQDTNTVAATLWEQNGQGF